MFNIDELGPEVTGNTVRFKIYLPGIENNRGFSVKVYVIDKKDQFDVNVPATVYVLAPVANGGAGPLWGEVAKTQWCSESITLPDGIYLYRFEITGPARDSGSPVRSLYFGDPCARETDVGVFSVVRLPGEAPFSWADDSYRVPPLGEVILYEMNVPEFGGTFAGVADRIPYLLSLGVNAIELLPISSITEPTQWGYMPIFHFAPEERFGRPESLRRLVNECHRQGIAVILDMVYAHTDRMFPYQIAYERFFYLWEDEKYSDATGLHRSPNPLVCAYDNFGKKNDWRMQSTHEFFAAVNGFWLRDYHVDGFRYDHVNGYLDRKPVSHDNKIDWYSQENRPTFVSLQDLSNATYSASKNYPRFYDGTGPSRIIQIAEDLRESAYQLSPISGSAINGNWEKRLADLVKNMAEANNLSKELGRELLLADERFDKQGYQGKKTVGSDSMPAMVVQFLESHDECRLFYLIQHGSDCGDSGFEYRNGLDDQPWWKLQPYAIALMTSVGIPMLWAGQEFAENTGLAPGGQVRVRGYRPLHWDYFYNVATDPGPDSATVLPLVTLYRKLGPLRRNHPALRSSRENAKEEFCNQDEKTLVFRRWQDGEVIIVALNFSDSERSVGIPFGHTGKWMDILEASYGKKEPCSVTVTNAADRSWVTIPSNFGRLLHLT